MLLLAIFILYDIFTHLNLIDFLSILKKEVDQKEHYYLNKAIMEDLHIRFIQDIILDIRDNLSLFIN